MLGWEFPPVFSGGLGIVTKNLLESLLRQGEDVTLLLPQFIACQTGDIFKNGGIFSSTHKINQRVEHYLRQRIISIPTTIRSPYVSRTDYQRDIASIQETKVFQSGTDKLSFFPSFTRKTNKKKIYGRDLFLEIERFVAEALAATEGEYFDLVHAHDWITAEAALQLKFQRNIPFVLHIHATEVDRVGQNPQDSEVFRREKYAMEVADKIIAVSHYTKGILVDTYGIDPNKIEVVHNAYTKKEAKVVASDRWQKDKSKFWVLFIGRVTLQKGPDYFVEMARKVVEVNPNIHFLIAGDGDMMPGVIDQIARDKLSDNVHCLGFLSREDRDALYLFTDACVIPSVSEPFGLTAIEGVFHLSPLVLSKTCGANELIHHKLPVDFWDTDSMAEYVLALQKYPALRRTLRTKALHELPHITWDTQAKLVGRVYESISN